MPPVEEDDEAAWSDKLGSRHEKGRTGRPQPLFFKGLDLMGPAWMEICALLFTYIS